MRINIFFEKWDPNWKGPFSQCDKEVLKEHSPWLTVNAAIKAKGYFLLPLGNYVLSPIAVLSKVLLMEVTDGVWSSSVGSLPLKRRSHRIWYTFHFNEMQFGNSNRAGELGQISSSSLSDLESSSSKLAVAVAFLTLLAVAVSDLELLSELLSLSMRCNFAPSFSLYASRAVPSVSHIRKIGVSLIAPYLGPS